MQILGMLMELGDTFSGSPSHWLECSAEWPRYCKLSIKSTEEKLSFFRQSAHFDLLVMKLIMLTALFVVTDAALHNATCLRSSQLELKNIYLNECPS